MTGGTFDFYNSSSIKFYNLDQNIRYQLAVLEILDPITKKHCMNVGNLCGRLCQYLNLNSEFTVYCITSGYLHDIGKSKVPYEILSKPTRLTDEEFEIIKKHTTYGYEMCIKDAHLRPFADGVLYHHEALNGTGYPQKLTAEKIPIVARIIRVADEYDALTTKRHYTTHVNISKTLQDMIEDTKPAHEDKTVALGVLSENSQNGKISPYILKALFKAVIEDTEYEEDIQQQVPMYVLSNKSRVHGAACILYPDILKDFAAVVEKDLYVLPSSIHEVILLPAEGTEDSEQLKLMVHEINESQVEDEEVLSDSVYFYRRRDDAFYQL